MDTKVIPWSWARPGAAVIVVLAVARAANAAPFAPQEQAPALPPSTATACAVDGGFQAEDGACKHYGKAALEIFGFQVLLNRFDNAFLGSQYGVSLNSIGKNLHSSWQVDRDPFEVNQLGHPYQGSVYHGLARSNGLNFWESLGYSFAASAVWEIAGETTPPSRNDQITTSFGGSFLGEALYRMAHLMLSDGFGLPPQWRELAAAVISPPLGFNRYMYPGSPASRFYGNSPALFASAELGGSKALTSDVGPSTMVTNNEMAAGVSLDYGLPGKPGYTYRRPFDYFSFRLRLSTVRGVESLHTRGLLVGSDYEMGPAGRGIWGLYGSYDYLAPQLFQVASTGLELGGNVQWWLANSVALQGHASGGIGYTSTGTVRGTSSRQYNYGFAPQAMLALRLIQQDRFALEMNARHYFNGRLTSPETGGTDRVLRGDLSLTYLVTPHHAVELKYMTSRRHFSFPGVVGEKQRRDTIGLYYVYLPGRGLGAVQW